MVNGRHGAKRPKKPLTDFGQVVDARRIALKLTQRRVMESIGVGLKSYNLWVTGEDAPSTDNLAALARVLGLSLDALASLLQSGGREASAAPRSAAFESFLSTEDAQGIADGDKLTLSSVIVVGRVASVDLYKAWYLALKAQPSVTRT